MHTTPIPTTSRSRTGRRRLALLVAPALALVIGVGCGNDDPGTVDAAVLGAEAERPSVGSVLPARPVDAGSRPRRSVAESTDRAAPVAPADVVRIGGVRIAAESADRVRPVGSGTVVAERYAGQAAAYAAGNVEPDRPIRVNGGRTED